MHHALMIAHRELESLAVQPGNGLPPFGPLPFWKGVASVKGNVHCVWL